jgi:RNA polymerase sigma factor (sigma-70 family)
MPHEPNQEPDPALLRRASDGDEAALGQLYARFADPLYTLAFRMLANREAAEDVVQDLFVALPAALRQFRGDGPFWAWLRRTGVTRVLMRMRAERARPWLLRWRQTEGAEADWIDEGAADAGEALLLRRDLDAALARLSPESRAVVWLYDVEGWTHPEIAAATNRTVSYSKSQLARAHARLRSLLDDRCEAGEENGNHASQARRIARRT